MRPNQVLGERYRLSERIGVGGMGEVWRAEDLMLERAVAIKALHPAMADNADHRQRFLREARTVAALNAPGIVAMYDTAEETGPDGTVLPYSVMEFVVGRPLSTYIGGRESPPPTEVMRLMAQVAHGLDAAHRLGIIHRDVKPANILINSSGDATLVDFGIARRPGDTALTTSGAVMGTTEYASPEQLRDEELTSASDVYSLGTVAYECLSGARPFEGGSVAAVIAGHLNRTPPPLPDTVPPPIARVVLRALAKDPRDRFGSAAEFAQACGRAAREATAPARTRDIRAAEAGPTATRQLPAAASGPAPGGTVVRVEPETAFGSAEPRRRRGRGLAVVTALVALVLAAAVVIFFTQNPSIGSADESTDTSGGADDETSPTQSGPKPTTSVLVSADNTLCLLLGTRDSSATAVRARMGLCQDNDFEVYRYESAGDEAVTIGFSDESAGERIESCLGVDPDAVALVADLDCRPETAWTFAHLRTHEGVDYWQIHSAADPGLCLQAGAEAGDPAYVEHCDDGVSQQWRTDAAA